jgi:hypothetical protein
MKAFESPEAAENSATLENSSASSLTVMLVFTVAHLRLRVFICQGSIYFIDKQNRRA